MHNNSRSLFAIVIVSLALFSSAALAQSGALKVTSFPSGANVKIDGVDTGKTTPMSTSLATGDHTVVVSIPNSGWNPDTRIVTIVSGNNDLSVTLLPMLTVGPQGPKGDKGDKGDTGATGATGPQGLQGPPGATATQITNLQEQITTLQSLVSILQQQSAGFTVIQQFTNPTNDASFTHSWTAPPGITHVLVEIWGGGSGGEALSNGIGGAYSRSIITVIPNTTYTITVGGGGHGGSITSSPEPGHKSSISLDGVDLIFASGGASGALGQGADPNASISHTTFVPPSPGSLSDGGTQSAYGASFCPNGDQTGKGGDALFGGGQPGYVLLTW